MGSWSSKHKRFLAFQIFQIMKMGRYSNIPLFDTQLDRFSRKVEAFHSMMLASLQLRRHRKGHFRMIVTVSLIDFAVTCN